VQEEECRELFVSLGANERGYIVYNDFRKAVEEASAAW
jgi:Ca2+-binding EF-hand superfamily protein